MEFTVQKRRGVEVILQGVERVSRDTQDVLIKVQQSKEAVLYICITNVQFVEPTCRYLTTYLLLS
jgi:hypothetical protein